MAKIRCQKCKEYYENYGMLTTSCPTCVAKSDEEYLLVRNYVKENVGATISEVSEITHVAFNKIVDYVKMEMLEIREDSVTFLKCQVCGKKIFTGILCDDCKKYHASDKQLMIGKVRDLDSKMHILIGEREVTLPQVHKTKKL